MDDADPGWEPLPERIAPMLATPSKKLPADESGWTYEMKWDGVRAIGYVDGGRLTLLSRNDHDVTSTYPELRRLGRGARVDAGGPRRGDRRLRRAGPAELRSAPAAARGDAAGADPAARVEASRSSTSCSTCCTWTGSPRWPCRTRQRRELLEGLELSGPAWQTPPALEGEGADLLEATREQGLEGVIAKRSDSPTGPAGAAGDWLKIKNILDLEVVIGGWTPGEGRRSGTIGALLLGVPEEEGLRYVGKVGTGFTDAMLHDLEKRLRRLERKTSPFIDVPRKDAKDAHWCSPKLVGEVAYSGWTTEGRLRHPSWRGLRPDKSPGLALRRAEGDAGRTGTQPERARFSTR